MAPTSKRKWSEIDDSDDEEPTLGKQVLPVANLPHDFNGVPMDGFQYLFTVRRDARLLPNVTRVANPYEIKEEEAHELSYDETVTPTTSHHVLPSERWRETFVRRFRNFRKNSVQPTISVGIPPRTASRKLMPDKKERDAWWAFLAGQPESVWNPPKIPKQSKQKSKSFGKGMRGFSEDAPPAPRQETFRENSQVDEEGQVELSVRPDPAESLPTPFGTPAPSERTGVIIEQSGSSAGPSSHAPQPETYAQPEPTPSLMQHLDHRYALHLLMYFAHWINLHLEQPNPPSSEITETHARWMFILLSRVEDDVSADEMSLLRNLARACMSLIKANSERPRQTESITSRISDESCWMIVTAVAGMWGQRDLWTDAETMLAGS